MPLAIVQARMSSSRLPGKVLRRLGGATVLDQVLRRAGSFARAVVVATSDGPEDDPIARHCERAGVPCVRGSRDDVFSRFRLALGHPAAAGAGWFARVTADCPLLSVPLARALAAEAGPGVDHVTVRHARLPRGLAVELVRRAAFEAIDPATLDAPEREHVTLRLYERPGRFACRLVDPPPALRHPELRLTLDYPEDLDLLRRIFDALPAPDAEAAVALLLREPALAAVNAGCRQKEAREAGA